MDINRAKFIIQHPYQACRQHVIKEIYIKKPFGANPEKTYYIIRCNLPADGLFAIFMYVLDHLAYAEDNGYIPVLDIKRYKCLYKEKKPVYGTKDPWRYYFEPITDIDRKECWKYKNVIYGKTRALRYKGIYYYREKEKNILPSPNRIDELYKVTSRWIRFRPELQKRLDEVLQQKLGRSRRTLGIHVRGTDMYIAGRQHPVPTGKTKDFTLVDKIINEFCIDQIFLCCDTDSTVKLFRDNYGEKLITTDALRQINDNGCGIHRDRKLGKGREKHKYLLGLEVITDMYILAHCNVLLCGPSNVAFAALIYNHNCYDKVFYCV